MLFLVVFSAICAVLVHSYAYYPGKISRYIHKNAEKARCRAAVEHAGSLTSQNLIIKSHLRSLTFDAVCSDVDGTLLSSQHTLSPRMIKGISRAKSQLPFFLCTGRSRRSMSLAVGPPLISIFSADLKYSEIPGVFQQGLMVYGEDGQLIFERALSEEAPDALNDAVEFCKCEGITVIAYAGDEIYAREITEEARIIQMYHEPIPTLFELGLHKLSSRGITTHKLILLGKQHVLEEIRPRLAALLGTRASLTSAVPGMLEVLPPSCHKGLGVGKLLEHFNFDPAKVVGFGDGENDLEFLRDAVGVGIAVANARDSLKAVADHVSDKTNDQDCVADILEAIHPA